MAVLRVAQVATQRPVTSVCAFGPPRVDGWRPWVGQVAAAARRVNAGAARSVCVWQHHVHDGADSGTHLTLRCRIV